MENIKKAVKESMVQNFMEAAKFARRGAEKQRPKSWSKGTKSGSDKRKMREEGKRDAREMNEAAEAFDPKSLDAASKRPFVKLGHGDSEKKYTASEYYAHLISQKIPHAMALEHTKLSFGMDDGSSRMRNRSGGDYVNLRDPNTGQRTRIAGHDAHDAMRDEFYESAQHDSQDVSETYYNKLKENTEIPRHARETPEETPDYYGELERQREAGTSGEEPNRPHTPESVAKLLQQAHETALARTATAFGPGGKHAKQSPFYMIKHYADELDALHTRVMGDASS